MTIALKIECAKGEVINAVESIRQKYELPPCIIEGILASVLADVRAESKLELLNGTNQIIREMNEELEDARKAAKKVLNPQPDEDEGGVIENGTNETDGDN